MTGKTLYDKLWDSHLVKQRDDGTALIYIDRQLIHEVTSPQAFDGLRMAGRRPWRAERSRAAVVVTGEAWFVRNMSSPLILVGASLLAID